MKKENKEEVRFKVYLPGPLLLIFLAPLMILPMVDLITDDISPEAPRWVSALFLFVILGMSILIPSFIAYIRAQNEWIAKTFNKDGTLKIVENDRNKQRR